MIISLKGTLPRPIISSIYEWVKQCGFKSAQGICSGTFHQDEAARKAIPDGYIGGNDVSLLSVTTGKFLMGNDHADITFCNGFEPLNDAKSRAIACASLASGLMFHSSKRLKPHTEIFDRLLSEVDESYDTFINMRDRLALSDFASRDLRQIALETQAECVVGFPPTYKGGYERIMKDMSKYVQWEQPSYTHWDPDDFPDFCAQMNESGKGWLLGSDQYHDALPLLAINRRSQRRAIYLYGQPDCRMFNSYVPRPVSLFPVPIDPDDITPDSRCDVSVCHVSDYPRILEPYLKTINSQPVRIGFIITIDGLFAGGFSVETRQLVNTMHIGTDFAVTGKRRLSKLTPMLTRCNEVKRHVEHAMWYRYKHLSTHVISKHARSMKYRGTGYKHVTQKHTDHLVYRASWSGQSIDETFQDWLTRHWSKTT